VIVCFCCPQTTDVIPNRTSKTEVNRALTASLLI